MQKRLKEKAEAGLSWPQARQELREEDARLEAMNRARAYLMREDGMSFSEIAEILGVNSQKAYWLYAKAEKLQYMVARNLVGCSASLLIDALKKLKSGQASEKNAKG